LRKVARAAIATPGLERHRIDERIRELRVLVDYRADLVKRRTMAINQLKAQVHLWLNQTPRDLTRARNVNALATLISKAQLSPHVRQALADMTAEITTLSRHVGDLDGAIRKLVSPLATSLLQVTGISYNSAAVIIAEIGDITRFSSSAKLARYAGCAPIPVCSSGQPRHRLHRGGNRRLNSVLYTAAIVQKRRTPEARQLLARHEPAKGPRGARRILQRHLADVIYRAMTADQAAWQHQITRHQLAA
jgi:transposase